MHNLEDSQITTVACKNYRKFQNLRAGVRICCIMFYFRYHDRGRWINMQSSTLSHLQIVINTFMHNVGKCQTYSKNLTEFTAGVLKYVWPFYNVKHEMVNFKWWSFPMHSFSNPPGNIRKSYGFLIFSGCRERVHWEQWVNF